MRATYKIGVTLGTALLCVGLVVAQQPGGGRPTDPVTLLRIPAVQKELKLSEEQTKKVDQAILKALGEVLEPDQLKRLRQISLQAKGTRALAEPAVQEALKLSNEQRENIKTIAEDTAKEIKELFKDKENFKDNIRKVGTLQREMGEKIRGVLNADQKKAWEEMIGEKFDFPQGKGFFKGKDKTE
jgi:hypothetical protein